MNREMNDDQIGILGRQIDLFSEEAQRINDTLEGQKAEHKYLKEEKKRLKSERRALKAEIQEEMRMNKRHQITC
jgi:chromosome segregation ATPase